MVASEVEVPEGAIRKPFRLRGGNFTLLVLPLADLKDQDFFRRLLDQVSQAPNFFHNAPVVLDLAGLSDGGPYNLDRKSVVSGKSVSVRVNLGGRRISTKQKKINDKEQL